MKFRELQEDDYPVIIGQADEWWGRRVAYMLPRLFLRHFHDTSLAAVDDHGNVAGFLVGIVSPAELGEAHSHFMAVAPDQRRGGLGKALYEAFFALARERGCRTVTAVVSPVNTRSQQFHLAVGFVPVPLPDGSAVRSGWDRELPVWSDWDGPGEDRIRFVYTL